MCNTRRDSFAFCQHGDRDHLTKRYSTASIYSSKQYVYSTLLIWSRRANKNNTNNTLCMQTRIVVWNKTYIGMWCGKVSHECGARCLWFLFFTLYIFSIALFYRYNLFFGACRINFITSFLTGFVLLFKGSLWRKTKMLFIGVSKRLTLF